MHLTRIAIYRPVATMMAALALMFLGAISYRELQVQRFPDLTFPALAYSARSDQADLSPEQTNDLLTRPLEKLVASLPGLKRTYSSTSGSMVWGYAEFEARTDMRFRVIELQDKISRWLAGREDIMAEVYPQTTERMQQALMTLILEVPADGEDRVASISDRVTRKIKSIDGVATVEVDGDLIPNLVLESERDALLANDLTLDQLMKTINDHAGDPRWMGTLEAPGRRHGVQLDARAQSLDELLALGIDANGVFRVRDLVAVKTRVEPTDTVFRTNGKKAVRITVGKERDRNAIRMARLVRAQIEELRAEFPPGFGLTVLQDEARDLEELIANLARLAATGALLSMLVLLVFVRSWRIALVVGVTIPAAILVTFNALYASGLSINILSLLGLTAGVGMLVDNSIVVVENVFRTMTRIPDRLQAAWLGSRQVIRALVSSTATNLVVFVPLLFMDDELVLVIREMALALIFPMGVSLLIAITLIPMLTARLGGSPAYGRSTRRPGFLAGRLARWNERWNPYGRPGRPRRRLLMEFVLFLTKASLRHPIRLISTILIVLVASLLAAMIKIGIQQMMNEERTQTVLIYGKSPAGSDLEATDRLFRRMEETVRDQVAGSDVFEGFSTQFTRDGGEIELRVARLYRSLSLSRFIEAYGKLFSSGDDRAGFRMRPFPRATAFDSRLERRMESASGTERILVTGDNIEAMQQAAARVRVWLERSPDVNEVRFDAASGDPEVHFIPDLELMQVMQTDLAGLQTFFQARDRRGIPSDLVLRQDGIDRRVMLKLLDPDQERIDTEVRAGKLLGDLRRAKIATGGGGVISLDMLGAFAVTHATPDIVKEDRQRNLALTFNLKSVYAKPEMTVERQNKLRDLQRELNGLRLPAGVSATLGGTLAKIDEQRITWKKLLALAVLSLYLVLAFFFESLVTPLIVLVTIPLATIGAIWGMLFLLWGSPLDAVGMLGTIILVGLVVNNGILLIEFTQQMEREQGWRRTRALLAAVHYRVRPIMMTTLTSVLGLLPILLSREAGREARSLVAVLVGGLLTSAILALVVIPTVYNVVTVGAQNLERVRHRLADRRRRRRLAAVGPSCPAPVLLGDAPDPLLIEIENVSKIYPRFRKGKLLNWIPPREFVYGRRPLDGNRALYQVSLRIEPGMFGLLGPNGAGKSSLMKILTGIIPQTYGVLRIGGVDLRRDRTAIRRWISYLPQNFGVYEALTLEQYLEFFAPYYGLNDRAERRRAIAEAIEWVGLSAVSDKPMKRFSGGMRQRAGIAQLLLRPRPIMIVDEPTAGLDPVERVRFRLLLAELARSRVVLLSTHIVDDITSSCRRVAVLNRGQVVFEGETDEIRQIARGLIWDVTLPAAQPSPLATRSILFRKHLGDAILYHYCAAEPLPGSLPVEPSFEDAYVALLWKHNATLEDHNPIQPAVPPGPGALPLALPSESS